MYHRQWGRECDACMMVLRAVRDVLNNPYHDQWIGRGHTASPPHSSDFVPWEMFLITHIMTDG
jgi:hypothetical protein